MAEIPEDMVLINGHQIPIRRESEISLAGASDDKSGIFLLRCKQIVTTEDIRAIRASGGKVDEMIDNYTCLCSAEPSTDLSVFQQLSFVSSVGRYPQNATVAVPLEDKFEPLALQTTMSSAPTIPDATFEVMIVLHHPFRNRVEEILERVVRRLGVPRERIHSANPMSLEGQLTRSEIYKVGGLEAVRTVVELSTPEASNDQLVAIIRHDEAKHVSGALPPIVGDQVYKGDGQTIIIADGGLDETHPAFKGRIKALDSIARKNEVVEKIPDQWGKDNGNVTTNDADGHGTHVAATALGSYTCRIPDPDIPPASIPRTGVLDGVAPKASLIMQSLGYWKLIAGRPQGSTTQTDYKFSIVHARKDQYLEQYDLFKARIWSGSFGNKSEGKQDQVYGELEREADQAVYEKPDLVLVKPAGNSGDETASETQNIDGVNACRNVLTVGACTSLRKTKRNNYNINGVMQTDVNVPLFSSRGPAFKGCIKPDVIAPGCAVFSARSKHPAAVDSKSDFDTSRFMTGSSMATPCVAGAVACIREALIKNRRSKAASSPSAALIKAIIINTADDLSKFSGRMLASVLPAMSRSVAAVNLANTPVPPAPNGIQGWGRLNLTRALNTAVWSRELSPDQSPSGYIDIVKAPLVWSAAAGSAWMTSYITIPAPPSPQTWTFLLHLVWTDYPGESLSNNLNVTVTSSSGQTEYSGDFARRPAYAATALSNVRFVKIENIASGMVTAKFVWERALEETTEQTFAAAWRLIKS